MDGWHDCPTCGKPNSAYGDNFCGECEAQYQRFMEGDVLKYARCGEILSDNHRERYGNPFTVEVGDDDE